MREFKWKRVSRGWHIIEGKAWTRKDVFGKWWVHVQTDRGERILPYKGGDGDHLMGFPTLMDAKAATEKYLEGQ